MLDKMLSDLERRVFDEVCERGFLAPDDGAVREVCERLLILGVVVRVPNPLGGDCRFSPAPGYDGNDREPDDDA